MDNIEFKNLSGHGEFAEINEAILGWNWGAFWLTWIWGIGNRSYIALLSFIPVLNLIMPFYLGLNGNKLAWSNKYWYSVEDFKHTQKKWAKWGWLFAVVLLLIFIASLVDHYKTQQRQQEIGMKVISKLEKNIEAKEILGENYMILSGPSLITIGTNLEQKTVGGYLAIEAKNEIVFINFDIGEEDSITKITLSVGANKDKVDIEIYP